MKATSNNSSSGNGSNNNNNGNNGFTLRGSLDANHIASSRGSLNGSPELGAPQPIRRAELLGIIQDVLALIDEDCFDDDFDTPSSNLPGPPGPPPAGPSAGAAGFLGQ